MEDFNEEVRRGTIHSLHQRGYGFVRDHQTGDRLFFHASGFPNRDFDRMREGHEIAYMLKETARGLQAYAIRLVTEENDGEIL